MTLFLATTLSLVTCSSSGGGSSPVAPPVITVTPNGGDPIESDGAGLLPENLDGSTEKKPLGMITDNKNSTNEAIYDLAEDDAKYDNEQFEITNNELFWKGSAVDFETASEEDKIFTIKIVRYNNEADATVGRNPQIFDFIINLRDVLPTITGNEGATTDTLPYLAIGNVGDGNYKMIFAVAAEGDTLMISFRKASVFVGIEPQYNHLTDPNKVTGFVIDSGVVKYATIQSALNNNTVGGDFRDANVDFTVWDSLVKSVEYIGVDSENTPAIGNPIFADVVTLTSTEKGIVVGADTATTDILANFGSADTATFSLTGIDALDFNINPSTGEFRFENAPNYETPADANGDNQYRVTINANDGVNTETFDLLVVVKDVSE